MTRSHQLKQHSQNLPNVLLMRLDTCEHRHWSDIHKCQAHPTGDGWKRTRSGKSSGLCKSLFACFCCQFYSLLSSVFSGVGLQLGFLSPHRRIMFYFVTSVLLSNVCDIASTAYIEQFLFEILSVCHGSLAVSCSLWICPYCQFLFLHPLAFIWQI